MSRLRFRLPLAIGCAALVCSGSRAADLPPDLAVVPADAAVFVHIRVGDIYKSDHMKDVRAVISKAGPEALKAFSERFVPDPTTLDRVTLFVVMSSGEGPPRPMPSLVFRMSKPFDAVQVQKSIAPKGEAKRLGNLAILVDRETDMAMRIIDAQTLQIGPPEAANRIFAAPSSTDGPLAPALTKAISKPVMMAFNAAAVPPELRAQIPAPAVPIAKLKLATFSIDLAASAKVDLRLIYPDAESAGDAEQMIHTLIEMGRSALVGARAELEKIVLGQGRPSTLMELPEATGALVGLGALRQYEDLLKALPLKRDGAEISLNFDVPPGMQSNMVAASALAVGLLVPATQKVREAAGRSQSSNNLKQLALAMHNYNDVYGKLPAHAIYSKDGKTPLLSWRVAVLPFMEQDNLYKQFHLDEPWDSEHNKKLIPLMPKFFTPPNAPPPRETGMTYYQIFVGGGAPWERNAKQPNIPRTFVDGTSNTIMFAEAGDPVIWTKPDDLEFDPQKPLPRLGRVWSKSGFLVALADGSVRSVNPAISDKTMRAAITAAGNEILGPDWD